MTLSEHDRKIIDRAREVADLQGTDTIRQFTGEDDGYMAVAAAFGIAQELLTELAVIALRQAIQL